MKTRSNDSRLFAPYEPPVTDASADTAEHATHTDAGAATSVPRVSKALQMHAGGNLRTHMWRGVLRVCVLLASDLGAFLVLRTALRGACDWTVFHSSHTDFTHWLFGEGALGGWQYAVALVVSLVVRGAYGAGDNRRDASRLFSACALATALPLWAALWSEPFLLMVGRYVLTMLPAFFALLAFRILLDRAIVRFAPSPHAVARAVLVGQAGECIEMRGRRALTEAGGFKVLGFVDVQEPAARGALGSIGELERILLEHRADTLILCGLVDDATVLAVMRAGLTAECQVLTASRRFDLAGVAPALVWRRGQPFIMLRAVGLRWHQLVLKRILDIVLSSVALAVLSPLMLLISAAVRLESPGPVVFRQRRLRKHGQWFECYKFRSMYSDAEARLKADPELYQLYLENDYKLPEEVDNRITRIGRFLRSTSLDELPQFWNVLKGDMSLVGPRPIVPDEIRHYNGEAPLLLMLKPGITGAWQVNGRSTLQYPERATVELEYVERWNLLTDLGILLRTIPAVLARRGAH